MLSIAFAFFRVKSKLLFLDWWGKRQIWTVPEDTSSSMQVINYDPRNIFLFPARKRETLYTGSIILFCCVSLQSLSHSQDKVKTKVVEWRVVFQGGHSVCLVVSEKSGEAVSGSCCSIREKSERDHWSFSHTLLPGFCRSWNKHSPLQKWLTLFPPVKVVFNLMTLFDKIWIG